MRLHAAGGPGAAALLSSTVQSQENDMTELVMTTEAEVEDFTDELSDEALDRAEGAACGLCLSFVDVSWSNCLSFFCLR
jgi:hypothetical protein